MIVRAKRGSGVLMHISSLSSEYGIGDMGPAARRFVEFLSEARQHYWQVLPLNPTDTAMQSSPYSSNSSFAANPLFISPEILAEEGLLSKRDLEPVSALAGHKVDYIAATAYKKKILHLAFERFKKHREHQPAFEQFSAEHSRWLDQYALFVAIKHHFKDVSWCKWPAAVRDRDPDELERLTRSLADQIEMHKFLQYLFHKQWFSLKQLCNEKGIQIIGDIPIYVTYDSVDVWAHPEIFKLDEDKQPTVVAGVPPDYFSKTGQRWGNPIYQWDELKKTGFDWWVRRIEQNLKLFDFVRIDHFRGLVGFWEIPAGEKTAVHGNWVPVPTDDFFNTLIYRFQHLPIIAEDLGIITDDVRDAMRRFGFPGMKVLQFAFGADDPYHPYLAHNYERNYIVYTGTHDNNTTRGWFEHEASEQDKKHLIRYLGHPTTSKDVHWDMIRLALSSIADVAIIPMQDILGLGAEDRMNTPSTVKGNWQWRLAPKQITRPMIEKLGEMTHVYGRE